MSSPTHRHGKRRFPRPSAAPWRLAAAWLDHEISRLDPGCFALVMATGIISNALFLHGWKLFADVMFAVALAAYACLWLMTILRAARFFTAMREEILDPRRVFLFFTAVAATNVLGTAIGLRGFTAAALSMWLLATVLWFILIYLAFGVLMFVNNSDGADIVEGAWLNAIVGTQSLVILGAAFALPAANTGNSTFVLLAMLWMFGVVLYAILIALLSHRIFFVTLKPDEVSPTLWIVMGAAAITVNAGSLLISHGADTAYLRDAEPFFDGVTLTLWTWATWWIPLLLALGVWKHGIHRIPILYSTVLWSIVFPLGMYAVATLRLSRVTNIPVFESWSSAMMWVALSAWLAVFTGLLLTSAHGVRTFLYLARWFGRRPHHG